MIAMSPVTIAGQMMRSASSGVRIDAEINDPDRRFRQVSIEAQE
jgi:hypothetical protein